jgi:hypothetical protein
LAYTIEIHRPGGAAEAHEVQAPFATLGTSSSATIRVPEGCGFLATHLELFASEGAVRVQVPAGNPSEVVFEGREHKRVRVPLGSDVFVSNVRICFLKSSQTRWARRVLLLTGGLGLVFALWGWRGSNLATTLPTDVPAPPLFASHTSRACPVSDPVAARSRARDQERAANAKVQRSAFVPSDGVEACTLFEVAHACFLLAGSHDAATEVDRRLAEWRVHLDEQYTTLRLHLRSALDEGRTEDALRLVVQLQSLLAHQTPGAYRQWLEQLEQGLASRLGDNGHPPPVR